MKPGVLDDVVDVLLREDGHEASRKRADILLDEVVQIVSEETVVCAEIGALNVHSFSHSV